MWIRFHAFAVISQICSCQVHWLLNIRPKCLCWVTLLTGVLSIDSCGWIGGLVLREIINSSVLLALNLTSHCLAQECIFTYTRKGIRYTNIAGPSSFIIFTFLTLWRRVVPPEWSPIRTLYVSMSTFTCSHWGSQYLTHRVGTGTSMRRSAARRRTKTSRKLSVVMKKMKVERVNMSTKK